MGDSMEVLMLKNQIKDMENSARMARSATLNAFLDLMVMLDEEDLDAMREMLDELTGDAQ